MITFEKIRAKNFFSVGNQFMEIDLNRSNQTLITGHNGSGKTTLIIEALTYTLFGKPYRKINLDTVVNTKNNKHCVGECEFTTGGVPYKVVRGEKPKRFEIHKNGELIESVASNKEHQALLESIIGMDYKVFCQVVVLNKSRFEPFMSLTTPQRRFIVEELLDISIYSKMLDEVKSKLKTVKTEIYDLEHSAELKQKDIEKLESVIAVVSDQNDELIADKEKELYELYDKISKTNEELENCRTSIEKLMPEVEELSSLKTKMDQLKQYGVKFQVKKESLLKTQSFYSTNDTCSACDQPITEDKKAEIENTTNEEMAKLNEGSTKLADKAKELSAKIERMMVTQQSINDITATSNNISYSQRELNSQVQRVKNEIEKAKAQKGDIDAEKKQLLALVEELKEVNKERQERITYENDLKYISLILKDDGIKTNVIRKYLPRINTLINKHLLDMNLPINYVLDETFNDSVKIPGKEKIGYYNFSDGQKTRIDLSILMTWVKIAGEKNSVSTNLLVLDEVLEALDLSGIEDFLTLFKMAYPHINLFCITQRKDELSSHFKSQIEFKLVNDFTVKVN